MYGSLSSRLHLPLLSKPTTSMVAPRMRKSGTQQSMHPNCATARPSLVLAVSLRFRSSCRSMGGGVGGASSAVQLSARMGAREEEDTGGSV